jgi:hypothetical protein
LRHIAEGDHTDERMSGHRGMVRRAFSAGAD